VIGISVQFLMQSYECTGSGSLHITATRFRQNAPNHIQNSKSFPPDTHRLRALPQTPVPDWKSEKVATLAEANHWRLATGAASQRLQSTSLQSLQSSARSYTLRACVRAVRCTDCCPMLRPRTPARIDAKNITWVSLCRWHRTHVSAASGRAGTV